MESFIARIHRSYVPSGTVYLTVKFAAGFTGLSVGWKGTEPSALRMGAPELLAPALPDAELPEVGLADVELPEVELLELEFPEVELPELGLALPELPEFALLLLELLELELFEFELLLFEFPELELLELELLEFEFPEFPELALGFKLVEPVAAALVLPELALGARLVEPVALALVLPELALGAWLVDPELLADVPDDTGAASAAKARTLERATATVRRTAMGNNDFMHNYSRCQAFSIGGVHLPLGRFMVLSPL